MHTLVHSFSIFFHNRIFFGCSALFPWNGWNNGTQKKNKNLAPKLAPKAKKGFRKQFPESFKSLINGGVGGFRTLARLTTPNDLAKGSRGIYTL